MAKKVAHQRKLQAENSVEELGRCHEKILDHSFNFHSSGVPDAQKYRFGGSAQS